MALSPLTECPISELSQTLFPLAPEPKDSLDRVSRPLHLPEVSPGRESRSNTGDSDNKNEAEKRIFEDSRLSISEALLSNLSGARPNAKKQKRRKKSAFRINKQMLVRIYLDEASWNTIVIKNSTTVNDIVRKICWKRSLDPNQSVIECNGEVLQGDQVLFPAIKEFHSQGLQPVFTFFSAQSELSAGEAYERDVFFSGSSAASVKSTDARTISLASVPDEPRFSVPLLGSYIRKSTSKLIRPKGVFPKMNSSRMEVLQTFSIVANNSGSEEDEKEDEIPYMGDFHVIKINNRGRRQKRVLRITADGVENIRVKKNSSSVSSRWTWSNIRTVFRKDSNHIYFKLIDKKDQRDRVYETEEAGRLLQTVQKHIEYRNRKLDIMAAKDMSIKIHKRIMLEEIHGNRDRVRSVKAVKRKITENLKRPELQRSRIAVRVESWLQNSDTDFSRYISSFLSKWKKSYRKEDGCLDVARSFMDQLKDVIISRELSLLSSMAFPNKAIEDLSDGEHDFINIEIDKSIEQYLIPQLLDDLWDHLERKNAASKKLLEQNCDKLQNKGIKFYQCSKDVVEISSLHNWDAAVMELTKLPRTVLPSMKLLVISETINMIYCLASASRLEDSKSKFLSGDDILPICIYVIVQATKHLKSLCYSFADHKFIDQLISRDTLKGETEYYLTVFEACLCHLADNMVLS